MKKLMTMIAAVATAFGLYAADEVTQELTGLMSFAGEAATDNYKPQITQANGWGEYSGADGTLKITGTEGARVLDIATGSAALSRNFANNGEAWAIDATKGLFFDTRIDFKGQALDEIPTLDGTEKLGLFVLDTTTMEGVHSSNLGTNLYLIAGYGANQKALYRLSGVDMDTFLATSHRVTIKAYKQALKAGERPGFMVYVDGNDSIAGSGVALAAEAMCVADKNAQFELSAAMTDAQVPNYLGFDPSAIYSGVAGWANNYQIFLSLDSNYTPSLTSVDFVGNATLASVNCTDEKFDFIPADASVMSVSLSGDATLAIADVTGGAIYDGNTTITVPTGITKFYVKPGNFNKEIKSVKVGTTVCLENEGVYTIEFVKDATIEISQADAAAYVTTTDGEKTAYATFAEAFEALADGSTLKLAKGITCGTDTTDSYITFGEAISVTLDLAGQTISGTGVDEVDGHGVIYVGAGTLTVTNSAPELGGEVKATGDNGIALNNAEGAAVVIWDGKFTGPVQNEGVEEAATYTGISINGGAFSVKPEGATIPSDKKKWCEEAEKVGGYWVLVDKPTEIEIPTAITGLVYDNTLKIGVAEGEGYTLTGNTATDAGEYTATATLKAGYIWSDKSTETKEIKWTIAKATATIEVADFTDEKFVADMDFPSANVTTTPNGLATVTVWTDGEGTTVEKPAAAGTYTATVSLADSVKNYAAEAKSKTLTITAAEDPVIDPTKPGEPVTVEANSETEAKAKAMISVPAEAAAVGVAQATYEGYFTKTVINLGDNKWSVSAKLSDDVVKAAEETKAVATKLSDIAAATEGTSVVIPADKVKPGLYYTLKEGQALAMPEQSESKMAKPDNALTLPAKHYDGSGFYQLMVTTAPIVAK